MVGFIGMGCFLRWCRVQDGRSTFASAPINANVATGKLLGWRSCRLSKRVVLHLERKVLLAPLQPDELIDAMCDR